jgi:hypothetical protein
VLHRSPVIRASIGAGTLAGIALSLPLWLTRVSHPNVPALDFIPSFPKPLDFLFLLTFAISLAIVVWRPQSRPISIVCFSAAALLAMQDQSRLQPWFVVYMLLLMGIVFAASEQKGLQNCRLIIAALYFWSGMHKMNLSFIKALFPVFVSPFSTPALATEFHILAILVPYFEMGIGIALLFPRFRRAGVFGGVLLHLSILIALGPWALSWNSVVWPWNLAMLVLMPTLFWRSDVMPGTLLSPRGGWVRAFLFVFVVVLPPLSLVGLWDTYLSFDLYSGNPLIGSVILAPEAWGRLDEKTRALAEHSRDAYMLRIDDWSQSSTNAPAYPAERVLRRVAQSLCKVHEKDNDIIFLMEKPARWFYRPGWHTTESAQELCTR